MGRNLLAVKYDIFIRRTNFGKPKSKKLLLKKKENCKELYNYYALACEISVFIKKCISQVLKSFSCIKFNMKLLNEQHGVFPVQVSNGNFFSSNRFVFIIYCIYLTFLPLQNIDLNKNINLQK